MKNIKYKILGLFLMAATLLVSGCGEESFQMQNVVPPLGLTAYPGDRKIFIEFYGTNEEINFDGFNVYISRTALVKNQSSLSPVKNSSGGVPTIIMSLNDIYPSQKIEFTINYDGNGTPIENGITYFISVRARDIFNEKSEWCNEESTTSRIENKEEVTINANDGFDFAGNSASTVFNLKITNDNGTNKAYLKAAPGVEYIDAGYYSEDDWRDYNIAPDTGYFTSDIKLLCSGNHIYIFKTENKFGKIWIRNLRFSPGSITFKWAFQQVENINHI